MYLNSRRRRYYCEEANEQQWRENDINSPVPKHVYTSNRKTKNKAMPLLLIILSSICLFGSTTVPAKHLAISSKYPVRKNPMTLEKVVAQSKDRPQLPTSARKSNTITINGLRNEIYPKPLRSEQIREAIRPYIQQISDLCKTNSIDKQVSQLRESLENLSIILPLLSRYGNTAIKDRIYIGKIESVLFGQDIAVYWERYLIPELLNTRRVDFVGQFLMQHHIMFNYPDDAGPEIFRHDWQHKIYKGLYCLSHGRELLSNVVYGRPDSGGLPARFFLLHPVDEPHVGNHVGQMAESA